MAIKNSSTHAKRADSQPSSSPVTYGLLISKFSDLTAKLTSLVGAAPTSTKALTAAWAVTAKAFEYGVDAHGNFLLLLKDTHEDIVESWGDDYDDDLPDILLPASTPHIGDDFWRHPVSLSISQISTITRLIQTYRLPYLKRLKPVNMPEHTRRALVHCTTESQFRRAQSLLKTPSRHLYIKEDNEWVFPVNIGNVGKWNGDLVGYFDRPSFYRIESDASENAIYRMYAGGYDIDRLFADIPNVDVSYISKLLAQPG